MLIAFIVTGGGCLWLWANAPSRIEREVGRLFLDCVTELNTDPRPGRDRQLKRCVTTDVVIEFGPGSSPIRGRDTLLFLVERLQRRIAAFLIKVDDLSLEVVDSQRVQATFTVSLIGRNGQVAEGSFDAQAFAAEIRNTADGWRMSRLTAVAILR